MTALDRGEHGELLEVDYEELPPSKNGRIPRLRDSDATNLAGVDTGRHSLSHTRLSVWLACHRKFELDYLKRLEPVAERRHLTLGKAYQKAIEWQDPEVGVRYLNGWEPCETCRMAGYLPRNDTLGHALNDRLPLPEEQLFEQRGGVTVLLGDVCPTCKGAKYAGEQVIFHTEDAERQHLVNEAIVKGASTLYLKKWPGAVGEAREVEYRVRLRSPWTGAYSNTYDLLGYADGVIDPFTESGRIEVGRQEVAFDGQLGGFEATPDLETQLAAARAWEATGEATGAPLELIENKLVGRIEAATVKTLLLNRQIALARYGLWRATGRPVVRVWYRFMKKPSIKQRGGRKADKSDAETIEQFCERVVADYEERPDFYAEEHDPRFVTTGDLLRIEADLWELATDMRSYLHNGSDGRRRAFPRDTSRCSEFGGCEFIPICTGLPDANDLYHVRPKRSARTESAPEAEE